MTGVGGRSKIAGGAVWTPYIAHGWGWNRLQRLWTWFVSFMDKGHPSLGSDAKEACNVFPAERRDLLWVNPCLCLCLHKSYVLLHSCNESSVRSWNKNKTKKCKIERGVWKRPSLFHSLRELIDSSHTHRSSFLHEPFIKKILLLVFLYLFLRYSTRGLDSFLQVLVYIIFYNFKVY